jgi:hypothetical protein
MPMSARPFRSALPTACAVLLVLLASSGLARAQGPPVWSAAGPTGVPDETSTSLLAFDAAAVGFVSSAPAASVAVLRYPVGTMHTSQPYFGVVDGDRYSWYTPYTHLKVSLSFLKPDEGAYASATLKRVRVSDGIVESVSSVNTLSHVSSGGVQVVERTIACPAEGCFRPDLFAYYIEVVLWKQFAASSPRVFVVRTTLSIPG